MVSAAEEIVALCNWNFEAGIEFFPCHCRHRQGFVLDDEDVVRRVYDDKGVVNLDNWIRQLMESKSIPTGKGANRNCRFDKEIFRCEYK